jgi:hypothetical protein
MTLDVRSLKTRTFWMLFFAACFSIGLIKNLVQLCFRLAN